MTFSIGVVGVGQFGGHFAHLFKLHPGVSEVYVVDERPERAAAALEHWGLDGTKASFEELLASDVDAVAIFTQRWTHGPLVEQALRAGKHVYSAVPMAVSEEEIERIIEAVKETGLVYAMGETSYYNPATVYARNQHAAGKFGRIFYSEGDYVHDMDLGFYDGLPVQRRRRLEGDGELPADAVPHPRNRRRPGCAARPTRSASAASASRTTAADGVFDKEVSMFGNDFSNATALFELDDGGAMRTNEMRRVGYPSHIRESRFRLFGTEASFEQLATVTVWQDKEDVQDISEQVETRPSMSADDPTWRTSTRSCGTRSCPGWPRCTTAPASRRSSPAHNGHEGSHQFLVDDFVTAVNDRTLPPINAWVSARFTLPGIVAHASAQQNGERLPIRDFGDAPPD